jgi:hypothetical protein
MKNRLNFSKQLFLIRVISLTAFLLLAHNVAAEEIIGGFGQTFPGAVPGAGLGGFPSFSYSESFGNQGFGNPGFGNRGFGNPGLLQGRGRRKGNRWRELAQQAQAAGDQQGYQAYLRLEEMEAGQGINPLGGLGGYGTGLTNPVQPGISPFGFGGIGASPLSPFGSTTAGVPFGAVSNPVPSPYGSPYPYGTSSPYGTTYPYGATSPFGAPSPFGATSPFGTTLPGTLSNPVNTFSNGQIASPFATNPTTSILNRVSPQTGVTSTTASQSSVLPMATVIPLGASASQLANLPQQNALNSNNSSLSVSPASGGNSGLGNSGLGILQSAGSGASSFGNSGLSSAQQQAISNAVSSGIPLGNSNGN